MPDEGRRLRRRLRNLTISRVDLVKVGANPGATIELFKHQKEEQPVTKNTDPADFEQRVEKAARERVAKSAGKLTIEQATAQVMEQDRELRREYVATRHPAPPPRPDAASEFLKRKREELGLSQVAVAKAADLPPQTLSDIENGARPRLDTFAKAAQALGCTTREIAEAGLFGKMSEAELRHLP